MSPRQSGKPTHAERKATRVRARTEAARVERARQIAAAGPDRPPAHLAVWAWSDTHFCHRNIAAYAGRPHDHEQRMLAAWAELPPGAPLLHLGDLAMGSRAQAEHIVPRDTDRPMWLIRGNHDRREPRFYEQFGFELLEQGFALPFLHEGTTWTVHAMHDPADAPALHGPSLVIHGHIHQHGMDDPRFINLAVEHTDYHPLWLPDALAERIALLARGDDIARDTLAAQVAELEARVDSASAAQARDAVIQARRTGES